MRGTCAALPETAAQGAIARHPSVFDETDLRGVRGVPASGSVTCRGFVSLVRESAMKPVGKPDAGNRHVRFDERGWETGRAPVSTSEARKRWSSAYLGRLLPNGHLGSVATAPY